MRSRSSQSGFTLIELLITILIIGILAAVSLGAYNGQRARAKDAQAMDALRTAYAAVEAYYTQQESYRGIQCYAPAPAFAAAGCGELNRQENSLSAVAPTPEPVNDPSGSYSATAGSHADPKKISVYVDQLPDPWAGQYMEVCNSGRGRNSFCIIRWRDPDNPSDSYVYYGKGQSIQDASNDASNNQKSNW